MEYIKLSGTPKLQHSHDIDGKEYSLPYDLNVRSVNNGIAVKTDTDKDIVFTFDEIDLLYAFKNNVVQCCETSSEIVTVKPIRATVVDLEPEEYVDFIKYAISTQKTDNENMNRVRKEFNEHVRSKRRRN